MSWSQVPADRITELNGAPVGDGGELVVYWMVAARRVTFNFALQRAADWARHLGRPLLILEALRADYPWASERLHRFVELTGVLQRANLGDAVLDAARTAERERASDAACQGQSNHRSNERVGDANAKQRLRYHSD